MEAHREIREIGERLPDLPDLPVGDIATSRTELSSTVDGMDHPSVIQPSAHASYRPDKMGKSTIFESAHLLVGLNAFEPGQSHALHAHAGMDKVYSVLEGEGLFLLESGELPMRAGDLLVAPEGVPHGVRNTGNRRLLVLTILAPAPAAQPL